MSDRGPVMILTASAGAGHVMAGKAIAEAFAHEAPQVDVVVQDLLEWSGPMFRATYARGYLALVNHAPTLMGLLYDGADRPPGSLPDLLRRGIQYIGLRRAARRILECRPRLVINTHFLSAELLAGLRRAGRVHCPQFTVMTDFEAFRLWAQQPTERYFVASEVGAAGLERWGVDRGDVRITGIPVRAPFATLAGRGAVRRWHGLPADVPVVLLLCGGFGVGPAEEMLAELLRLRNEAQVVVITGRNEPLRRRLEAQAAGAGPAARVLGYTDRIHEWMQAADLIISKPGWLTSAEALCCGTPLVIVRPIPGHEARNSDFLLEHGAAIKVNHVRLLRARVDELLDDRGRIERLSAAARDLARPDAAVRIVRDALEFLEISSPRPRPRVVAVG